MNIPILIYGVSARTTAADVEVGFDLLVAGAVDAEAGLGDAAGGVAGAKEKPALRSIPASSPLPWIRNTYHVVNYLKPANPAMIPVRFSSSSHNHH
ncbi:MAG: hypothetical protein IT445_12110 [Phycisphaeraceae bacterium]|nr:hypothetical protein [Phycisphaeraceae bacterium]